jgi:hypothetical protein
MRCFLAGLIRSAMASSRRTPIPKTFRTDQIIIPTTSPARISDELLLNRRTAPALTRPILTTTFTPSAGCLSDIYLYNNDGGPYATLGPPEISDCFPAGWRPDLTARFSPGICPSGYIVACSSAVTIEDLSETTATCCPRYVRRGLPSTVIFEEGEANIHN